MNESTGGYENTLLRACWKAGMRVTRLSPFRVRDFDRCRGLLAKTDAIDARAIFEVRQHLTALTHARAQPSAGAPSVVFAK